MPGEDYYFISDLHIGGDAELDACDFEPELLAFLKRLEAEAAGAELIVVGDAFGLWEVTDVDGPDKMKRVIDNHPELFEQFRRTGERMTITLIPGNHDYELAAYPELVDLLAEYNLHLEPKEHITRPVAGRTIWIEHGSQRDSFNRIAHFGEPYVTPLGYYVTRHVVGSAGRHATLGRRKWLRYVESVQPNEQIPHWLFSNYFYREMSPLLRYGLVPFLVLYGISIIWFFGAILETYGILPTRIFSWNFMRSFGIVGDIKNIIFTVNSVVFVFLILFSIPFAIIWRDVLKTLRRYGLQVGDEVRLQKKELYCAAAEEVFAGDPQVAVFVFGHTHGAFLEISNGRAIINTGTWLKRLTRIKARFRRIPAVYAPSYRLSCFRIHAEDGRIAIEYERIPKKVGRELTLLERLMILGKSWSDDADIPERTLLPADNRTDAPEEG